MNELSKENLQEIIDQLGNLSQALKNVKSEEEKAMRKAISSMDDALAMIENAIGDLQSTVK